MHDGARQKGAGAQHDGKTERPSRHVRELLGATIDAIQIPAEVAGHLEQALLASQSDADQDRRETRDRLEKQHRALLSKLDRGYDDYLEGRISEDFWTRKSEEWEDARRALEADVARLDRPSAPLALTVQKILELAKQAGFLYRTQDPSEQRRLLDTVLSNCTFDRGSLCPPTVSRSTCSSAGTNLGIGGEGGIRTLSASLESVSYSF